MKEKAKVFLLGILAGASIGLGGLLFTIAKSYDFKLLPALVFSIGLLAVCSFSLYLFTGKIGFLVNAENKKSYALDLLVGYIGNIIGAVMFGYLCLLLFSSNQNYMDTIASISNSRCIALNAPESYYRTIISGIFCGMLVYIAVYGWKKDWPSGLKVFLLVFAVFAFVASGFEHCIANMFYISFANSWNISTIVNILLVTLGNSIGSILLALAGKVINKK